MISDEELKAISQVDPNEVVENYCKVFSVPQDEAKIAMGPVMRAREMATELLTLREEKRHPQAFLRAALAKGFGYAVFGETEVIAITVTWEDADLIGDAYGMPVMKIEDILKEENT